MKKYYLVFLIEKIAMRKMVLSMYVALAHKGLKSPKRFTNLPSESMSSMGEHVEKTKF